MSNIKKYEYISETDYKLSEIDNEQSRCFCITWDYFTYDNLETMRRMEHVYKRTNRSNEKRYTVKYIYFWIGLTEKGVPFIQACVQFTNRMLTTIVSNIYNGGRVIKTFGIPDKKSFHTNSEEYGTPYKQGNHS
jgi:hypothetical protein